MSLERYDIRSKIGEGGVGAVYRAFDRNLNREVAIKRVLANGEFENQEEATARMLKEATALCSVQHPHIVTVYDAGVDKDGPYVVMELLSGRTIDEMVQKGVLSQGDFRELAVQSQEALIAAQELDLVHRDIKPSNLMVTWLPSGRFHTKLVDFGLAKFSATPSHQTIDHGDAVFGSIRFMAPEQFERTPLDKRTDMYAIGCVYYYCLTGRYPFDGETAPQVMAAHLQHQVAPISELRPDLPEWLCKWVMWHISRSMDDRPADALISLKKFLMSENNPEAGTPEVPQAASPSDAPAPQADSIPPVEDATAPVTPETAPQPVQAVTPPPQAAKPKLVIPGQQPAPAQPAPVQPTAPVAEVAPTQPVAAPPQLTPAPAPQAAPAQPVAPAPVPQAAPIQPAAQVPAPQAAPVQPVTPAPAPLAAPIQPTAPVQQVAPAQPEQAPQAAPVQPLTPAPAPQAAPVQQTAPVLQTGPVQPVTPAPAPVQPTAPVPQAAPVPAPQITVPLSGTPAAPAPAAQPAANPLLVAGATAAATPAPQPAAQPTALGGGAPPQPAAPTSAGVGIGSVALAPKKGMSNAVKGMIITTLVAGLIVAGIIWKGTTDKNDDVARLTEITSAFQDPDNIPDDIPLSESDVQLLLDELTTVGVKDKLERPAYLSALTKGVATDGVDISAKIAGYAKDVDMEEALRIKLFQVVGLRGEESALPALIEFAKTTSNTGAGQAAITAAKNMATSSNFKSLLAIVTGSDNASIKSSAVGVLTKVIGESDDPGAYANAIVGTYNGTPDDDGRIALISLMGAAGGDEAADIVNEKLKGDNDKLKVAAIYALRSWPDETQFDTLYEFANDTESDRLRKDAFESLVEFLEDRPKLDEDDKSLFWYDVASIATGEIEQRNVIGTMVSQTGDFADDVIDYYIEFGDSDKVQAAAEKAKFTLSERKKRSGRKRSSSRDKKKASEEEDDEGEEEEEEEDE